MQSSKIDFSMNDALFETVEITVRKCGLIWIGSTINKCERQRCAYLPPTYRREQAEISGSTLLVYWYVFKKGDGCGVREVQRALGFSSSGTAHYHLEKLEYKGLVTKDSYGNYVVNNRLKIGVVSPFVFVRGFVFPRQLIYATASTIMWVFFLVFFWKFLTPTIILALFPSVVASGIFWFETVRLWASLPSFKGSVR